jgi:hypothetical protein
MAIEPGKQSELLVLRARVENVIEQLRIDRSELVGNLSKAAQDIVSIDHQIGRLQQALERTNDD